MMFSTVIQVNNNIVQDCSVFHTKEEADDLFITIYKEFFLDLLSNEELNRNLNIIIDDGFFECGTYGVSLVQIITPS